MTAIGMRYIVMTAGSSKFMKLTLTQDRTVRKWSVTAVGMRCVGVRAPS